MAGYLRRLEVGRWRNCTETSAAFRSRGFESRSCRHAEMRNLVFNVLLFVGRMAEWLMASVLKTEAPAGRRGFESPSFL